MSPNAISQKQSQGENQEHRSKAPSAAKAARHVLASLMARGIEPFSDNAEISTSRHLSSHYLHPPALGPKESKGPKYETIKAKDMGGRSNLMKMYAHFSI